MPMRFKVNQPESASQNRSRIGVIDPTLPTPFKLVEIGQLFFPIKLRVSLLEIGLKNDTQSTTILKHIARTWSSEFDKHHSIFISDEPCSLDLCCQKSILEIDYTTLIVFLAQSISEIDSHIIEINLEIYSHTIKIDFLKLIAQLTTLCCTIGLICWTVGTKHINFSRFLICQ